jgi:hypothetical protein
MSILSTTPLSALAPQYLSGGAIKLLKVEVKDLVERGELLYVNLWEASRRSQSGPDREAWKHMEEPYRDLHLKVEKTLLEKTTDLEILL